MLTAYTPFMALPLRLSGLLALGLAGCFHPMGSDPSASSTTHDDPTAATSTATNSVTSDASTGTSSEPTGGATEGSGGTTGLSSGSTPICGDGIVDPLTEECDDANPEDTDGCTQKCRRTSFYVFVTSGMITGALGGFDGANAFCQGEAAAAQLKGTFRAWVSDAQHAPLTHFGKSLSRPYVRRDDMMVAANWDALVQDGPLMPISKTAFGETLAGQTVCVDDVVWTGTGPDGLPSGDMFCAEWTNSDGDMSAAVGSALTAPSAAWTNCGSWACGTPARLYCFEQALE